MTGGLRHKSLWLYGLAMTVALLAAPLIGLGQETPDGGESQPVIELTDTPTATPMLDPPTSTPTQTPQSETPAPEIPAPPTLTPVLTQPLDFPSPTSELPAEPTLIATAEVDPAGSPPIEKSLTQTPLGEAPTGTATPAETGTMTATATSTPTALPTVTSTPQPLSIRIESADLQFGRIDASGEVSGASSPGLFTEVDQTGALFNLPQAVTLVVEGDQPWVLGCSAISANPASARLITASQLQWRLAGSDEWIAFGTEGDGSRCLTNAEGGSRIYVLDIRLRVDSTDPPGPFAATLAFDLAQQ